MRLPPGRQRHRDYYPLTQSLFGERASPSLGVSQARDNWARRDPDYSPTPYAQLAAALTFLALLKPVLLLQEYHEDNAILSGPLQQARPAPQVTAF